MNKKIEAQQLYMQGATQKEIAASVGVTERTIWNWVHQHAWDKLRLASYQAPVIIADNLCSQIVELQNTIAARPQGNRYATMQEAGIMQKLINMLEKMKKTPSLSQSMQMLETFRNYVRPIDQEFSKQLAGYAETFLQGKAINGYAPYEPEYGIEPVPSVMPFYPDTEENQKEEVYEKPCASSAFCRNEGACTYPKCLHSEMSTPTGRASRYKIPAMIYKKQQSRAAATAEKQRDGQDQSFAQTKVTDASASVQTGNEPEAFSQLAPTG